MSAILFVAAAASRGMLTCFMPIAAKQQHAFKLYMMKCLGMTASVLCLRCICRRLGQPI